MGTTLENSKLNGVKLFTGKQLISNEINSTCTKYFGRTLFAIVSKFPDINILDAKNVINDLELAGSICVSNGLIFKA